jgi:hypothetical protein
MLSTQLEIRFHTMLEQIAVGLALVCITTIMHAAFMIAGLRISHWRLTRRGPHRHELSRAISVATFTAWMFIGVVSEALLWALSYLYSPEITRLPDLETALYFSMVTFTSVCYGVVLLTGPWRILASIETANGVIIFGWTTALIFYHLQTVYTRK